MRTTGDLPSDRMTCYLVESSGNEMSIALPSPDAAATSGSVVR